jgi:5-methylcytosine-specific restriction endonuclease McrA
MEYILFIIFIALFIWISDILDNRSRRRLLQEHARKKASKPKPKPYVKSPSSNELDSTPLKPKQDQIAVTDKQAYLKSDHWQAKRKARLKRDNYTCQACGISGVPLEVHHLHYRTYTAERPKDLVSLCRRCHERQHQHYGFDYNTEFYPLV